MLLGYFIWGAEGGGSYSKGTLSTRKRLQVDPREPQISILNSAPAPKLRACKVPPIFFSMMVLHM